MDGQIKTKKSISLLVSFVTLIYYSISSCSLSPTPTATLIISTPTTTPIISSDKAIEIAINGCKTPHLVLVGEPENIRTKLLTLEEADKLTRGEGETIYYGKPKDTKVWLVQMDGQLQLVGGPAVLITDDIQVVKPTPAPPVWGTCTIILDASSGDLISIRG